MTFTPFPAAIDNLVNSESGPVMLYIHTIANSINDRARTNLASHTRTGRLASSGRTEFNRDATGSSVSVIYGNDDDLKYAAVLDQGADPHPIYPQGKALFFFWDKVNADTIVPVGGGRRTGFLHEDLFVIGKGRVDHPGHAPTYFLSGAIEGN